MTKHQDAIRILNKCQKFLTSCRQEAISISKDPHVLQWQEVNIDSFMEIITALGLPITLRQTRDKYPAMAKELLASVTSQDNSINNLLADVKHGGQNEKSILAQAKQINRHCQTITPFLKKLQSCRGDLQQASITLKENLSMHTLLPIARGQVTGKKRGLLESGYEVYLTITQDQNTDIETTTLVNMYSFFERAAAGQKKVAEYERPSLPPIAMGMVEQYLYLCQEGFSQVKLLIDLMNTLFAREFKNFNTLQHNIKALKERNVTDILSNVPQISEELSACLRNFSAKKFLLQELSKAEVLLENCEDFFIGLKNYFIPYLHTEISKGNSILNPHTLAISRSKSYFKGLIGMWRVIRMMLFSFSGNPIISQKQLEEKLHQGLADCHMFYSQETNNASALQQYIASIFEELSSPFPGAELTNLFHKSLFTYSAILQKVFIRYRPTREDEDIKAATLGRLSSKIEIATDSLQKYQEKSEKMMK